MRASREVQRVICVEEKGVEGMRRMAMTRRRKDVNWGLDMFGEIAEVQ